MVLYILTGYWMHGIVSLDQLTGARHTHTHLITIHGPLETKASLPPMSYANPSH